MQRWNMYHDFINKGHMNFKLGRNMEHFEYHSKAEGQRRKSQGQHTAVIPCEASKRIIIMQEGSDVKKSLFKIIR